MSTCAAPPAPAAVPPEWVGRGPQPQGRLPRRPAGAPKGGEGAGRAPVWSKSVNGCVSIGILFRPPLLCSVRCPFLGGGKRLNPTLCEPPFSSQLEPSAASVSPSPSLGGVCSAPSVMLRRRGLESHEGSAVGAPGPLHAHRVPVRTPDGVRRCVPTRRPPPPPHWECHWPITDYWITGFLSSSPQPMEIVTPPLR